MEENKNELKTKVCRRCGRELPVSSFNRHAKTKDGLQPFCRECQNKIYKEKKLKIKIGSEPPFKDVVGELRSELSELNDPYRKFSDVDLIDELKRRGYTGTIIRRIEITL